MPALIVCMYDNNNKNVCNRHGDVYGILYSAVREVMGNARF